MSFKLRGYQQAFVEDIQNAWKTYSNVLGVLPTGAGKTVCFTSLIHAHRGYAAAIVHRKEIVGQISLALARLRVKHRIIAPSNTVSNIRRKHLKKLGTSFIDPHSPVGVVSVQTITSKTAGKNRELQKWIKQVTLAVYDEGHHYVAQGLWGRAVEYLDSVFNAKLLFVTATPQRADGKGLGKEFDGFAEIIVEGPTAQWLADEGYLCSYKYKAPSTDLDVSNIPVTASGDLNTKELRKRVVESHLVGDVVSHFIKFAENKQTIVFATDVETANEMEVAFQKAGINACALSGETEQTERDRRLDEFEDKKLKVLINVDLFDEGFDVPAAVVAIMARPTESLTKYLQMAGRVLRPDYALGYNLEFKEGRLKAIHASEKPHAIIIDCVRNWERHGLPYWPREWSLASKIKGNRESKEKLIPQRICTKCTQPYEMFYKNCPYCGWPAPLPEGRNTPETVAGDLIELDVNALSALFAKIQQADMSDDEFVSGQVKRRVPPIGRSVDLKRHQKNKYRRAVLRELVAWWVGLQPQERTLSEVQQRFYYRFGIDIGTAFTLKARDTDALIERIQQRFSEDMLR